LRIAYFSPLPPQRSGIADYSRELLPHLTTADDVTVFVPDPKTVDDEVATRLDIEAMGQFEARRADFDLALYHIGNSEHHDEISRLAIRFPGVIVLHDFHLHHSVARRTVGAGDDFTYRREMGYELGAKGVYLANAVEQGFESPTFEVPLNRRLLDASLGVIVHSVYVERLVRQQGYGGPLTVIPAQIAPLTGRSRRAQLDIPANSLLFASFGLITKEKQIANVLEALRKLRRKMPEAHYLLAGEILPDVPLQDLIHNYGLKGVVHQTGYIPKLSDFIDWIQSADIVINLRNPTLGETSATALRAMAAGLPLIVSDHGWYSELPSDTVLKVPPDDNDVLLEAMRRLGGSRSLREQMGQAGIRYTSQKCRPEMVAGRYRDALNNIRQAVRILG
jgi:glycosyltransferase involved in cell wall biosynthesis